MLLSFRALRLDARDPEQLSDLLNSGKAEWGAGASPAWPTSSRCCTARRRGAGAPLKHVAAQDHSCSCHLRRHSSAHALVIPQREDGAESAARLRSIFAWTREILS